ncbi:clusterin-like protein 1 [Colossoma macropomum]|uniref:clusterin-like protein 1 n=1 Tax=Colossoma macropomum TaxID=42526 RepID=UPI001863EF7D|nr:clusterin-like protein 1 [Colossoma macropomum]
MTMMKTQLCLSLLLSCLPAIFGAPQPLRYLDESQLKLLSAEGERYMDEEMKRALLGVKQMKETMDKTDERHQQLLKTLKQSFDKKRGAEQLAQEAEQKLQMAEQQCRDRLRPMWEKCRPCLQARCGSFYTSTCRRSSSSFSLQVEEFVRRMASKLDEDQDQLFNQSPDSQLEIQNQTQMPMDQNTPEYQNQGRDYEQLLKVSPPPNMDKDLVWIKNTFSRIGTKVASLYSHSSALVSGMRRELGSAFLSTFTEDIQPEPSLPSEHLQTGGFALSGSLRGAFDSFMEMGRSVLHEVSSALTQSFEGSEPEGATQKASDWLPGWMSSPGGQLCRHLRSRVSQCREKQSECDNCHQALLTECPEVPEHYSELSEISLLLNASRSQYEEVLQVLRTHTEHTLRWAENVTRKHAWVTHISNGTAPPHVFSLVKLVPGSSGLVGGTRTDTVVEVSVLDSPVLSLSVPVELELSDPAFIQYIAKEALLAYQNTLANALYSCQGGLAHPTSHDG